MTIHHRRSLRLKNYDYSKSGYYFITICTQNREHLCGKIVDDGMVLNVAGDMIHSLWFDIMNDFFNIVLHEFVIMPNHIHGIIEIVDLVGADSISALYHDAKPNMNSQRGKTNMNSRRAEMDSAPTISTMIQSFKRHTTLQYIKMVKNGTLPSFNQRIWQRNYYEYIIRDDEDYNRIATYIINNPMTWDDDVLSKE